MSGPYRDPLIDILKTSFPESGNSFTVVPTDSYEWLAERAGIPQEEIPSLRMDLFRNGEPEDSGHTP
jgi:hypothetical protein